jgi:hypothetical protein
MDSEHQTGNVRGEERDWLFDEFREKVIFPYGGKNPVVLLWAEETLAYFTETMRSVWNNDFRAAVFTLMETVGVLEQMGLLPAISRDIPARVCREFSGDRTAAETETEFASWNGSPDEPAVAYFETTLCMTVRRPEVQAYLKTAVAKLLRMVRFQRGEAP